MTEDILEAVLLGYGVDNTSQIIEDIARYNTVDYRVAVNSYFNILLLQLGVPLSTRNELIVDGTDKEWCVRFISKVIPHLIKRRSRNVPRTI